MDRHERGPSAAEGSDEHERDDTAVRRARRVAGAYALLAALAALADAPVSK